MAIRILLVIWVVGLVLALILVIALIPFTRVDAGEMAVVLRLGAVNRVLAEGTHWVTPFVEDVEKLEVRIQKEEVAVGSASKDLQTVSAKVALNFNLQPENVGLLWSKIGRDYKTRIIDPSIQEAVKAATAKYTAEELITKRELVKEDIKQALSLRLAPEYIKVVDVSITDFDFSQSFNAAIEGKVTAEQNALASKNKLEQVKYEAEQRVAEARGEAEAIRIQAQAIQAQGGKEYVSLKWVEKWTGILPQTMLGNNTSVLYGLDR